MTTQPDEIEMLYIESSAIGLIEFRQAITTMIKTEVKNAIEQYKKANHIGYMYVAGEVIDNYILLERLTKIGKNWKFRVMCRYCGNTMTRNSNKFLHSHLDCPKWGVGVKVSKPIDGGEVAMNNIDETPKTITPIGDK
jgi:hypothetical protein